MRRKRTRGRTATGWRATWWSATGRSATGWKATALVAALFAAALTVSSCAFIAVNAHDIDVPRTPAKSSPKSIVLLIGDGMGVSHVTGAVVEHGHLHMERLPVGGLVKTFPTNSLVTDSAASGTAFATGRKSYNGAISVAPNGDRLKTVLEFAEERGKSTGLVSTSSITHATPAVFAAHVENRDMQHEIAEQMTRSGVDVIFGGGSSYFLPDGESAGTREDGLDLIEELKERMPVALSAEEFRDLPKGAHAAAALVTGGHMPPAYAREPSLAEMTSKALSILSHDQDGFFLMIEGSQIDWAGHENEHAWLIDEVMDFDRAVGVALDFAEMDGRTLVIVTADHETGGYAVVDGSLGQGRVTRPEWGTDGHTAAMVPVLAYGPGSAAFGGINDNTHIGRTLIGYVTR